MHKTFAEHPSNVQLRINAPSLVPSSTCCPSQCRNAKVSDIAHAAGADKLGELGGSGVGDDTLWLDSDDSVIVQAFTQNVFRFRFRFSAKLKFSSRFRLGM